jgi:hypothetical protein
VRFADIWILEYSGLDPNAPFRRRAVRIGLPPPWQTAATSRRTTTSELVFAARMTTNRFTAAGADFTDRIVTSPDGGIAEDRRTSGIGSYYATAPLNAATAWLIQITTFRAAGQ